MYSTHTRKYQTKFDTLFDVRQTKQSKVQRSVYIVKKIPQKGVRNNMRVSKQRQMCFFFK